MWDAECESAGAAEASAWLLLLRDGTPVQKQHARLALARIFERRGMLSEAIALLEMNIRAGYASTGHLRWLAELYRERGDVLESLQASAAAQSLDPYQVQHVPTPMPLSPPPQSLLPVRYGVRAAGRPTRRQPRLSTLVSVGAVLGFLTLGLLTFGARVLVQRQSPDALSAMAPVSPAAVATVAPVRREPERAHTLIGEASTPTRAFMLTGGVYTLDWIAYRGVTDGGPFVVVLTDAETGQRVSELVRTVVPPAERFLEQVTPGQRIPSGHYFLDVEAPGNWVVTLGPHTP